MSLNFGAASSSVVFSIGNAANASNGAVTLIDLWKPTFVSGSNTGLVAVQSGASQRRSFLIDTSALFGDGDFTSGVAITGTAGDWLWVAMSKAAGAAHYRMHWRNFTTGGAWTHSEAAGAGNHTDPGVSDQINVGANAETAAASGDVAVSAIKLANMADLAIEAACTSALTDLMAAAPDWAVRFMNSAPSSIQDLTGGGGNETSRPGTVTNTADPAGFNFSLSSTVEYGTPQSKTPPGRGRNPRTARTWLPARSYESAATAATVNGTLSLDGAGILAANVAQVAPETLAGAGTFAPKAVQLAPLALAGAGALNANAVIVATMNMAAASTLTANAVQRAGLNMAGAGSVASPAVQLAPLALAGAGVLLLDAGGTQPGVMAVTGAATWTAQAVQAVQGTVMAGLASFIASAVQRAAMTMAGVSTAVFTGSVIGPLPANPSWSYTLEQSTTGWDAAPDITWTIEAALPVWRISQA